MRTQDSEIIKWFSGFSEGRTRIMPEIKWVLSEQKKINRMLLQTTEEHLLIKTRCVIFKLWGNDNKHAMLDCESGFHQSDDKRKLYNCHKLRSSYVTSIMITKLTFAMFLLKLSTLSAATFLFVSLVLSLLCGRSTGVFHYCFFLQHSLSDVDIRH